MLQNKLGYLLCTAAVMIGFSTYGAFGFYHPRNLLLLVAGTMVLAAAALLRRQKPFAADDPMLALFIGLGLLADLYLLRWQPTSCFINASISDYKRYWLAIGTSGTFATAGGVLNWAPLRKVWFPVVLLSTLAAGLLMIQKHPLPPIDVFTVQQDGSQAILDGRSPYSITIPMTSPAWTYPREVFLPNGRVRVPFVYPPLILMTDLPSYILFGDIRYSHLLALIAASALIGYSIPGRISKLGMCLLLFAPRIYFVIEMAWIEPTVLLMLAIVVWLAMRAPRYLWIGLALLFSSKQYFVCAGPLLLMLFDSWRERIRQVVLSGALALAIALPFIVWDPASMWWGMVKFLAIVQARKDSLGLTGLLWRWGLPFLPDWVSVAAGFTVACLCAWKMPRNASAFCTALAITMAVFFLLSKQAFGNYYHLVIGAISMALGTAVVSSRTQTAIE